MTDPLTWNPDLTESEKAQILAEMVEGDQFWQFRECKALMEWWTVGRFEEQRQQESRYEAYLADRNNEEATKAWIEGEEDIQKRQIEMLVRLAKLSPYLWS